MTFEEKISGTEIQHNLCYISDQVIIFVQYLTVKGENLIVKLILFDFEIPIRFFLFP